MDWIRQGGLINMVIVYFSLLWLFAGGSLVLLTRSRRVLVSCAVFAVAPTVFGLWGKYLGRQQAAWSAASGEQEVSAALEAGQQAAQVTMYFGLSVSVMMWLLVVCVIPFTRAKRAGR